MNPLLLAVDSEDVAAVTRLLAAGEDPDATDADGWSLLQYAARTADSTLVRLLLAHGADPNGGCEPPLHLAAMNGRAETAALLLAAGADLGAWSEGMQALHVAVMESEDDGWDDSEDGSAPTRADVVRVLLDAGAPASTPTEDGATPLHFVIDDLEVTRLLLSRGADVGARTGAGWTPLHSAAEAGASVDVVRALLDAGADPGARTGAGLTPAHCAAMAGEPALTGLLIEEMPAPTLARDDRGFGLLHAVCAGALSTCAQRLIALGADVHATTAAGLTPLHYAAGQVGVRDAAPDVVRLLLAQGARLEARDDRGRSPADLAFDRAELTALLAEL